MTTKDEEYYVGIKTTFAVFDLWGQTVTADFVTSPLGLFVVKEQPKRRTRLLDKILDIIYFTTTSLISVSIKVYFDRNR